jgi:hypothetical protein
MKINFGEASSINIVHREHLAANQFVKVEYCG